MTAFDLYAVLSVVAIPLAFGLVVATVYLLARLDVIAGDR